MGSRQRRDLVARRRRVEDEGDDEGAQDIAELDDDSLSEGSIISEDEDLHEGDEPIDGGNANNETSDSNKMNGNGSKLNGGQAKASNGTTEASKFINGANDMEMMVNGPKSSEPVQTVQFEDFREDETKDTPSPAIVTSTAQMDRQQEQPHERRRREHEEYKKKRDADPAFVPNRGAFFMHDHRHAGPAANGFRPFGRGRGGRGRPGIGGPYAPINHISQPLEPTDVQWAHDMHEVITEPVPTSTNGASNGSQRPAPATKSAPLNRSLSTTKHIGNVQILKQYTRLPDHRPPLRRDKPVRISLPDHPPRYIFPAVDRSFIFIPRAMRPNQQGFGGRGRGRAGLGSVGGYSRRTSVFGGSVYGSTYTPSVAMSRRSSLAREKPTLRENRPNAIPMHQPRPQKTVSVADIESPASMSFNPPQQSQQPFHQQVPIQINGNSYSHDTAQHSRQPSYPSQASTGTPLSQIPERAIHAPAFQPNPYQQPASNYYPQTYPVLQPPQGYYYPQTFNAPMASTVGTTPFVPAQQPQQQTYNPPAPQPSEASTSQAPQNLVAQEVNGMVYYYDAAQIPAVPSFPAGYQQPQQYPMQQVGGVVGMGGMMTPSPDGFYYPQQQGVVYYTQ
ncbi:hypothetical protein H4I96_04240 [Botrytis cinerea]